MDRVGRAEGEPHGGNADDSQYHIMTKNTFLHVETPSAAPPRRQTSAPASSSSVDTEASSKSSYQASQSGDEDLGLDSSEDEEKGNDAAGAASNSASSSCVGANDEEGPRRQDRRRRPNKARRKRFAKFLEKMEAEVRENPESFSFSGGDAPASITQDPNLMASIKARYEALARELANDGVTGAGSPGGLSSGASSSGAGLSKARFDAIAREEAAMREGRATGAGGSSQGGAQPLEVPEFHSAGASSSSRSTGYAPQAGSAAEHGPPSRGGRGSGSGRRKQMMSL